MLYGTEEWDPKAIIFQILEFQAYHYVVLGATVLAVLGPYVSNIGFHLLFDWRSVALGSFQGWMMAFILVVVAGLDAIFLRFVIKRAKKCLDFTATMYGIHFVIVWCAYGIPRRLSWYVLTAGLLAATASLGEWLCMQLELQDIPLTSLHRKPRPQPQTELVRQIPVVTVQP